jgi:hypothetical protein
MAKAFRRRVLHEVLPAIYRTGRYESGAARNAKPQIEEDGCITVKLPKFGRFVVTITGNDGPHILETPYDAVQGEILATDLRLVCHATRMTEEAWTRLQMLHSITVDTKGGRSPSTDVSVLALTKYRNACCARSQRPTHCRRPSPRQRPSLPCGGIATRISAWWRKR